MAEGDAANGLREQIKLVEDLEPKATANVEVTFHFHEKNKTGKIVVLPYSVIATQPGIAPGA